MKRTMRFCGVLVILLTLLTACAPSAATQDVHSYSIGTVWKEEGNMFSVQAVDVCDSYTDAKGLLIQAENGKQYIIATCKMVLSEGWEIAQCDISYYVDGMSPHIALHTEPIQTELNGQMLYQFVYCVPETDDIAQKLENYRMELILSKEERTLKQGFVCRSVK